MGIATGGPRGPRSQLDVTPLVDVVLVLLIIFLVAMPLAQRSVPVEVPPEPGEGTVPDPRVRTISVTGSLDGTVTLDDGSGPTSVPRTGLARTVFRLVELTEAEEIAYFVDFDDNLPYSDAVSIVDTLRGASGDHPVRIAMAIRVADRAR